MRIPFLTLLALLAVFNIGHAQGDNFRNPVVAPLLFNPGFAGLAGQQRITVSYRNGWPGLGFPSHLFYASYDQISKSLRGGLGAEFTQGIMGDYYTTRVSGIYSPKFHLGQNWTFSPTIKMGYQRLGDDLMFSNPWPSFTRYEMRHHGLNLSPGILLNTSNFYVGVASDYLVSLVLAERTTPDGDRIGPWRTWRFQSGYRFQPQSRSKWSLSATALLEVPDPRWLPKLTTQLMYNRKWLILGAANHHSFFDIYNIYGAVSATAGYKHERFRLLGVYSRYLKSAGPRSGAGSFECSLVYYLRGKKTDGSSTLSEL